MWMFSKLGMSVSGSVPKNSEPAQIPGFRERNPNTRTQNYGCHAHIVFKKLQMLCPDSHLKVAGIILS
jgi:hypothetical protein